MSALESGRYEAAFALLTPLEQRYFATPANLRSVYAADRVTIHGFTILATRRDPPHGTLALVRERVSFVDHAHQTLERMTVRVAYGLVGTAPPRITDPYHPWHAFATAVAGSTGGLRVTLRKVSFFTGRIEVVATFANLGERVVTVLPYGRTVLRDEAGRVYRPIETRLPSLTDKTLYTGLRLPPDAQYTGAMTFATPDRFHPTALTMTVAPALFDGADAPTDLVLPRLAVPAA